MRYRNFLGYDIEVVDENDTRVVKAEGEIIVEDDSWPHETLHRVTRMPSRVVDPRFYPTWPQGAILTLMPGDIVIVRSSVMAAVYHDVRRATELFRDVWVVAPDDKLSEWDEQRKLRVVRGWIV